VKERKGIPHSRVRVGSSYRSYRTVGLGYESLTELTELFGQDIMLYTAYNTRDYKKAYPTEHNLENSCFMGLGIA